MMLNIIMLALNICMLNCAKPLFYRAEQMWTVLIWVGFSHPQISCAVSVSVTFHLFVFCTQKDTDDMCQNIPNILL